MRTAGGAADLRAGGGGSAAGRHSWRRRGDDFIRTAIARCAPRRGAKRNSFRAPGRDMTFRHRSRMPCHRDTFAWHTKTNRTAPSHGRHGTAPNDREDRMKTLKTMKTMKTWNIALAALAAIILAANVTAVSAKEIRMTMSSSHPPIIAWVGLLKDFVVPESNKRLKAMGSPNSILWTEAYAGALYDFQSTLEGIEKGLGDIGWVGTLWEVNKMPLWNVTYFSPFVTENIFTMKEIAEELHTSMPILAEQWKKYNQHYLGATAGGPYVLISKTPVNSIEDLKGKKIYGPGAVTRWVEGTGAVGVDGGLPVYYNGIKTGIADGGIVPANSVLPFKLHEVAPHIVQVRLGGSIFGALSVNLDTWNGLPDDMKKVFTDLGKEYSDGVAEKNDKADREHLKILASQGAKVSRMADIEQQRWADALPDIAGDWTKHAEAQGLPAKQVLKAFMDGVRKRGEKPLRDWDK
jgi:TRAP-type C4-dicarboxylate transport system substrate-binding protein